MNTIKIIIADDHPLFLKGLKDALSDEADFEILDSASNGQEALDKIIALQPDVATLDLDMPMMNGIEVAKVLLKEHKNIKIVILSMHKDADIIRAAMALGINGYVFKDDAVNDLVTAIRDVYAGGYYISIDNANSSFFLNDDNELISELTKMEKLILKEIALQKTTKQIADENFISSKTVENHRANICRKLNLSGNNALLKFALNVKDSLK
ncbi:DNA-binding response regulator [Lacihabitans sp. LS3-19]|uniref:response regulator transcription factor n=1 Tax=Lacihabitans sp. LS3-19 TaxID=2487335 RepID=UPI0020CDE1B8|nr:response regulator transcription factor [Lacihabitans sp. LS3-19]MCP9770928.1 DNA-binding response regulator [Lacihabitans sp. LS3-19]